MMAFAIDRSRTIISAMILGRRVTAQDVAWLKREVFADREVTRESADELFAVVRADMDNAPEWKEFFVDMITEHVVRQGDKPGVVSDETAVWLMARVDECKAVEALAALVNVCAEAHRAPDWFVAAARRASRSARRPRLRPRCAQRPDSLLGDAPDRGPPCGCRWRALSEDQRPKRRLRRRPRSRGISTWSKLQLRSRSPLF